MSSTQAFIDEAAKIYKVLSNSTRLNILYYLRHYNGEADVKTIVNDLHRYSAGDNIRYLSAYYYLKLYRF